MPPPAPRAVKFEYFTIAPIDPATGAAFIGEPDKYISASAKRFVEFAEGKAGVVGGATAACVPAPAEQLRVCVWTNTSGVACKEAACDSGGTAVFSFP